MTEDCRRYKFVFASRFNLIRVPCVLLFLVLAFGSVAETNGQWIKEKDLVGPYVDSEPFDVIYLNKFGENAIMKVKPLGDKKPEPPFTGTASLAFDYFADNEDRLEVPISSVKKIITFNDLLVKEANICLEQQDFTKAFRNYLYVYDHGGQADRKLVQALNTCMFQDGKQNFQSGQFELALSIYEDIYQKDKDFEVDGLNRTLAEIVIACYDGIIQKQYDSVDYVGVRQTLATVVKKYQKEAKALNLKWLAKFKKKSDDLLVKARKLAREGEGRQAHLAAKQAEQMYPGREDTLELQKALLNKFPMVIVGVSQAAADADPERLEHFGSRRVGRLTQRTMIELTGLTDEGGKYEFLNGMVYRADELGLKYSFEIKDEVSTFGVPPVTAYQVAARLSALADESSPDFDVAWRKIVSEIAIDGENNSVNVTLRKPFIRPEGLLKIAYSSIDGDGQPDQNGPYVMTDMDRNITTFELNPKYERIEDRQHPVIVEQIYDQASTAVDELIAGNIDVVDRIPIRDVPRLKAIKEIETRPYLLPSVHMLVPKIRGEMEKNANFRNGLSHAIDRYLLVQDVICGGQEVGGCEPISGPFPLGTEENDQIAYGYDLKVRPLPFNTKLGMVLVEIALQAQPPKRPDPIPKPKLVLAHPDSSVATNAAGAIARMWTEIGVVTVTRKLKPDETFPPDDDWDFLYFEAMMEEPLADATKIIGPTGFAKDVSAPIEQTLRNLSYSETWQGTCSTLRRLHRQVAVDLSVLPLWQIKEHYAYRTTVREIGRDLIHLYQNVDRWKIDLVEEEAAK